MSADSPRRSNIRGVPAIVPPEIVSDRSIIDSVAGFINDVTLANQPVGDPKDTIIWARFESAADISDPRHGDDWELEGNVAPPLLLILGYGLGVQIWAIPANGEAVEVLSWRHGIVSALRILPKPVSGDVSRADEPIDLYSDRRPLMAICDGNASGGCIPQFCSVNFLSLRNGTQVKTIKFKNPVLDILANRTSVVVTFHERIAIFDARTLEDRLTVTTCFPSPGINPNPVTLGSRWLAYSENKLIASKRSGGGCDGDGVASYTATVLNAAKSLGKGLRELGEQVAAGLTGTTGSSSSSKSASFDSATGEIRQPGIVTILDIKYAIKDMSPTSGTPISINGTDPIVAHFIAHSEAIVAMEFDNSGMMLLTADKRGHNFHVFRIQPHPVGSTLAAVHHLYVLHRGDTSAKVQNISFSLDTRWVAVSTLRGTTHVFPITPYGGSATARTHSNLHVVNKLSSFHHSAGLTADGRSSSPISHSDSTNFSQQLMPYHNQTMPPFPRPTVVLPLAQLRQPFTLSSPPGSAAPGKMVGNSGTGNSSGRGDRQRLSSLSDDNGKPLSVCAVFAKSRSWLLDPPNLTRDGPAHKLQRKAVDSLFVMAGHGALIQYDLDVSYVAKEKKCDDKSIDLDVEAKAQWNLGRRDPNTELMPPLPSDNWLVKDRMACMLMDSSVLSDENDDRNDSWLAQVEMITHAGPSRRLWMGPQFVFKTYNTPSGSNLSHIDSEAVEIGLNSTGSKSTAERSSPLNMPLTSGSRSSVPVLIESGSYSSIEHSPKLMDRFRHDYMDSDYTLAHGESRLKEDLADAMRESPVTHKDTGLTPTHISPIQTTIIATASASDLSISSSSCSSSNLEPPPSIQNVVNPLGTVTTITLSGDSDDLDQDNPYVKFNPEDYVIHENCDESLFRPVVVFCDDDNSNISDKNDEFKRPPEPVGNKLIVPVIEKSVDMEITMKSNKRVADKIIQQKFDELSVINKKSKKKVAKNDNVDETKLRLSEERIIKTEPNKTKPIRKSEEREIKASVVAKVDVPDKKDNNKTEAIKKMSKPTTKQPVDDLFKSCNMLAELDNSSPSTDSDNTVEEVDFKKIITDSKVSAEEKYFEVASKVKAEETTEKPIEEEEIVVVNLTTKKEKLSKKNKNLSKENSPDKEILTQKSKNKEMSDKKSLNISTDKGEVVEITVKNTKKNIKSNSPDKDILDEKIDVSEDVAISSIDEEIVIKPVFKEKLTKKLKNVVKEKTPDKEMLEEVNKKLISDKAFKFKSIIKSLDEEVSEEFVYKEKSLREELSEELQESSSNEVKLNFKPEKMLSKKDEKLENKLETKPEVKSAKSDKKLAKQKPSDKDEVDNSADISCKKDIKLSEKDTDSEIVVDKTEKLTEKKQEDHKTGSDKNEEDKTATKKIDSDKIEPQVEEILKVEDIKPKLGLSKSSKKNSKLVASDNEVEPKDEILKVEDNKPKLGMSKSAKKSCKINSTDNEIEPKVEIIEKVDAESKIFLSKPSHKTSKLISTDEEILDKNVNICSLDKVEEKSIEEEKTDIKKSESFNKVSKKSSKLTFSENEGIVDNSLVKTTTSLVKKDKLSSDSEIELPEKASAVEIDAEIKSVWSTKSPDREVPLGFTKKLMKKEKKFKRLMLSQVDQDEPKISDFLQFATPDTPEDFVYKVVVKDLAQASSEKEEFPSLDKANKKSKKARKSSMELGQKVDYSALSDSLIEIKSEPSLKKSKDFPAMTFETVPSKEESLSPFKPSDSVVPIENETLINFESPNEETKSDELKSFRINLSEIETPKGFPKDIIFAICGHLEYHSDDDFLNSSSSTASAEESADAVSAFNLNDDEELRPLICGSMTTSTAEILESNKDLPRPSLSLYEIKSSDSSSDTGGGGPMGASVVGGKDTLSYAAATSSSSATQPQQPQNSKKKTKRRKR